jgi:tRNA U34 5-methylaminomethyl-2-thiouridine-forming methyltransferase MnmC
VKDTFTPVKTGDGSSTFYSETFSEWFHSREGAAQEAQTIYVEAAGLIRRVQQRQAAVSKAAPLKILDVCYGLGYNTAASLEAIWAVDEDCWVEVQALEIDIEPAKSALAQRLLKTYPPAVQQLLQDLATDGRATQKQCLAQMRLGDARQQIQPLVAQGWQADVIFLDPFSPPNCPQLWTIEFLGLVAQCLNPHGGTLVTYSCAAAMRTALKIAGLSIGTLQTAARQWPGTIACYSANELKNESENESKALPPLSQQEQEHLHTRAAIPYRDPTLQATAQDILERRVQEQSASPLMPTKPWRQRWRQRQALAKKTILKKEG